MKLRRGLWMVLCALLLTGCIQPAQGTRPWLLDTPQVETQASETASIQPTSSATSDLPFNLVTPGFITSYSSPTPDPPRTLPTLRSETEVYTVQPGDSLAIIAERYNMPVNILINANRC